MRFFYYYCNMETLFTLLCIVGKTTTFYLCPAGEKLCVICMPFPLIAKRGASCVFELLVIWSIKHSGKPTCVLYGTFRSMLTLSSVCNKTSSGEPLSFFIQ
uniref:Secreted protein n=1 Tax=Pyxicephalus adspersus TaxID=30357 RepID=A0AAV3AU75_PYXAD|nr:TPA: hypothetical protein GDO54_008909 [Pyxicephalus adspersus]